MYSVSSLLIVYSGTENGWPYLLLINVAPALLCLVFMPWLPDSPRFLMLNRKNRTEAEKGKQPICLSMAQLIDIID